MRIKKISTMFAVATFGLLIGTGVNKVAVNAADLVERTPVIEYQDAETGENKVRFIKNGHVDGAVWDAKTKTLTLDNFENRGDIYLDYYNKKDYKKYSKKQVKRDKKNHLKDVITVKVKGKCKFGAEIHSDCRMIIEGVDKKAKLVANQKVTKEKNNSESCWVNANKMTVKNIQVEDFYFGANTITFKNVKVDRMLKPYVSDKNEICYEYFASANKSIEINNCDMNIRYETPTKNQLKSNDAFTSPAFWAPKFTLRDSDIEFYGREAFKVVAVEPFYGAPINKCVQERTHIGYKVGQYIHEGKDIYMITGIRSNGSVKYIGNSESNNSEAPTDKIVVFGYTFKVK